MTALIEGAGRGAVAAMAMTGMRAFTVSAGIVEETPPKAIFRQKSKGLIYLVPRKKRRAAIELAHWTYGAGGGAMFGVLPEDVRHTRWAGPVYGLVLWLGFESALAPALGLSQAKKARPVDRLGLAADHVLYGLVLTGLQRRSNT